MRRAIVAAIVSSLCGCGLLLGPGEDHSARRDAGLDAGASSDAASEGEGPDDAAGDDAGVDSGSVECFAGCAPSPDAPFRTPVRLEVSGFPGPPVWSPSLSADALTMVFHTFERATLMDVWIATRADPCAAFTAPMRLPFVDTSRDLDPKISADGLEIVFSSDRFNPGGNQDLFATVRESTAGAWTTPQLIGEVSDPEAHEETPFLSADALRLYFSSTRLGSHDLFVAERPSRGAAFGAPVRVPGPLDDGNHERMPALSSDETVLYFVSDRPGGQGGLDVWVATRADRTSAFGVPRNVGVPVSSALDDVYPFLARDGSLLYLNHRTDLLDGSIAGELAEVWVARGCP